MNPRPTTRDRFAGMTKSAKRITLGCKLFKRSLEEFIPTCSPTIEKGPMMRSLEKPPQGEDFAAWVVVSIMTMIVHNMTTTSVILGQKRGRSRRILRMLR